MISTSQREHLTYSLILQVAILTWLAILTWTYILPWMQVIHANQIAAKSSIEKFKKIKESWLEISELEVILSAMKGKGELLKIIWASREATGQVIRKDESGDYINWLYEKLAESSKDRNDLKAIKMLINSILPTLSPTNSNIDEEHMTLKSYISFIEKEFLKKYNISSNIVLWVDGITYGADTMAPGVWNFELRLEFRATNENIQNLITYVNRSWNPDLLSSTGITISSEDTDASIRSKIIRYIKAWTKDTSESTDTVLLANPLMTVESLSLENVLDSRKPSAMNNGRITIRFYVRWSSQEDLVFLQNSLIDRQETLRKEIASAIAECGKQSLLCTNEPMLKKFETKYNEFSRSLDGTKWIQSIDITILWQISLSLRALNEEFNTIIKNTNRN